MTNFLKLRSEHLPIVLVAFSFAGGSLASLESRALNSPTAQVPVVAPANGRQPTRAFVWPGTYDIMGTGFSNGERFAILTITPRDTSYNFEILGPPGSLKSVRIIGDSAHVAWDMDGPLMMIDLRGSGDSLDGRWFLGEESGLVYGTRRP